MTLPAIAASIWDGRSLGARLVRAFLSPLSWLFTFGVSRRNAHFDRVVGASSAIPSLSIGNLTVGGTGKTPVAAWCVQALQKGGASPAIVMRGVGDDEWRVHTLLNPGIPVILSPDRAAGVQLACDRGADVAVLDDAFQHRRAARVADIVLVSADQWRGVARLLPAGPFREPLHALRRAHLVVVTAKAVAADRSEEVARAVRAVAPDVPIAFVRLIPGDVRLATSEQSAATGAAAGAAAARTHATDWLVGRELCVTTAIGDSAAFERQVRDLGAIVRLSRHFPDHYAYTRDDAETLALSATGTSGVLCTLKDAVKLAPLWPREAPPLWYLSQSVFVDRGADAFARVFARVLMARTATTPTVGSAGLIP